MTWLLVMLINFVLVVPVLGQGGGTISAIAEKDCIRLDLTPLWNN
jgi:hypothetical protein